MPASPAGRGRAAGPPRPAPASAQTPALPQLGRASLKEVLGALTPEEKVKLVVGMGFYPAGFPAGMLPAGDPGDDQVPERVPGAAGRTHAVPRLGIPSLTLSDGHNPVAQLKAGNDLLMPGMHAQTLALLGALKSGGLASRPRSSTPAWPACWNWC